MKRYQVIDRVPSRHRAWTRHPWCAALAQLVEHRIRNAGVASASLASGSNYFNNLALLGRPAIRMGVLWGFYFVDVAVCVAME